MVMHMDIFLFHCVTIKNDFSRACRAAAHHLTNLTQKTPSIDTHTTIVAKLYIHI